jgi:hypothetical protein
MFNLKILLALSLGLFFLLLAIFFQPRITAYAGKGDDGQFYFNLAEQVRDSNFPVVGPAPFVHRIGLPLIIGTISKYTGLDIDLLFRTTSLVGAYLVFVLTYFLVSKFSNYYLGLLFAVLHTSGYFGVFRVAVFDPISLDNIWEAITLGFLFVYLSNYIFKSKTLLLLFLTFFATLIREIGLVLPIALLLKEIISVNSSTLKFAIINFISGLAGFILARMITLDNQGYILFGKKYSFLWAAEHSFSSMTIWHFIVSFCLAFGGPLISYLLFNHQKVILFLKQKMEFLFFFLMILMLSVLGGINTLRFMYWTGSVFFILLAVVIDDRFNKSKYLTFEKNILLIIVLM